MAVRISPLLIARSRVSSSGTTAVTQVMDFELAQQEGIELFAVKHSWTALALAPVPSAPEFHNAVATLHNEPGTLEDPGVGLTSEVFDRDTELLDMQVAHLSSGDDSGAAQGGIGSGYLRGNGVWEPLPEATVVANNITHRAVADDAAMFYTSYYLVAYRFVRLTDNELIRTVLRGR